MKATVNKTTKLHIKRNDQVKVIAGRELGKQGKVLKVFPKTQRAIVEGLNFIKKAERPSQKMSQGGIIEKEAPMHISNLMVICRHCRQPTRTGTRRTEGGKVVRLCKKCGEVLER